MKSGKLKAIRITHVFIFLIIFTNQIEVHFGDRNISLVENVEIDVPICFNGNGSETQNKINGTFLNNLMHSIEFPGKRRVNKTHEFSYMPIAAKECKIGDLLAQINPNEIPTSSVQRNISSSLYRSSFKVDSDAQLLLWKDDNEHYGGSFCISSNFNDIISRTDGYKFDVYSCDKRSPSDNLTFPASTCSMFQPCIRKCCTVSEFWDIGESKCASKPEFPNEKTWKPPFYYFSDNSDCVIKISDEIRMENAKFQVGVPENCVELEDRHTIPSKNIAEFGLGRYRMILNGTVLMSYDNGSWIPLRDRTYCMDEIFSKKLHAQNGTIARKSANVLLVCKDEYHLKGPKKSIPIRYALMLFSAALILLFTVVVYLLVWDKHNIYEWTIFFQVVTMICMIVFLGISHTIARDPSEGFLGTRKCVFLGMASHYFFIATFFWLLVINFEIWWNFRTLTISSNKSRKWLRLLNYQVFAWICPAMIVLTGWILDKKFGLQNDEIDCTSMIVPNYGQLNCYISKRAQGPYLYFPMGVLLASNFVFYILTVFKMCQYQKSSQRVAQNKSSGHFQPIVVFARLFIVMGVSWVFEIVSWALSPGGKGKVPLYWIVFDIVTLVQAIAIFVIFVCRKEIIWKLKEKYPRLTCVLDPLIRLFSCEQPTTHLWIANERSLSSISQRNVNVAVQIDLKDIQKSSSSTINFT